jgi:dolichyl-phosphate-mannose--protein O-mannosyl transferase
VVEGRSCAVVADAGRPGSGSGQQSVTGFSDGEDANDYWLVQSFDAKTKSAHVHGRAILKGDVVILRHMATSTWLHSHDHKSPLSNNQEVSAYVGKDDGNFWEVQNDFMRAQPVRLKHVTTEKFLTMNSNKYSNPIPNQYEVAAQSAPGPNTVWVTTNGIYFEETTQ